jgi:hypothetical protein
MITNDQLVYIIWNPLLFFNFFSISYLYKERHYYANNFTRATISTVHKKKDKRNLKIKLAENYVTMDVTRITKQMKI